MSNKITNLHTFDIRFPTSESLDGSDAIAINKDPDYSATYILLETTEQGNQGFGLIFTLGRGSDLCCRAVENMRHLVLGKDFAVIKSNIGKFYNGLRSDTQLGLSVNGSKYEVISAIQNGSSL